MTALKTRKVIESCVDIVSFAFPFTSQLSSLLLEARLFITLLLARHTFVNDPSEILDLALKLAELLSSDLSNPHDYTTIVVRPLDIHLYTLTGFTILELIDSEDADLVKPSQDALTKLRHALQQISERAHQPRNRLDSGQPESTYQLHWADALLQVINVRVETGQRRTFLKSVSHQVDTSNENDQDQVESSVDSSTGTARSVQVLSAQQKYLIARLTNVAGNQSTIRSTEMKMTVIDFSLLTRKGYLNVLAELNGF